MTNADHITAAAAEMAAFDAGAAHIFRTQPFNRAAIAKAFRAGFRTHSPLSAAVCNLVDGVVKLDQLDRRI